MSFINAYADLLIMQYRDKPKAEAEIKAKAARYEKIFKTAQDFNNGFDVDSAIGNQLDIIGSIVQMPRAVESVIKKSYFGFDDNTAATGMGDKFSVPVTVLYPLKDKFEKHYTDSQLNDADYARFIKLKIARNTSQALISSGEKQGVQESIINALNGRAFIVDNKNMTLTVFISGSVSDLELEILRQYDLIARPCGILLKWVRFNVAIGA